MYTLTRETAPTIAYSIGYFDLPSGMQGLGLTSSNWPLTLENIRRNMMGDDGKLITQRQLNASGRDATELVLEIQGGQARVVARIYPTEQAVYEASVVMPNQLFVSPKFAKEALIASNHIARFFDSIEFVK
jgi:hypothetical protein